MTRDWSRWLRLAFFACLIFAAASISTSWINTAHNADTVLQALISIDHWTPYYWGENRLGMLVPLIVSPIRSYGWNLIFQVFLVALSGVGSVWLMARLTGRDRPSEAAIVATPLIAAGVLLLFKSAASLVLLLASTYLTPLFLALLAIFLATQERRLHPVLRTVLVLVLFCLSFWINISVVVLAGVVLALWPAQSGYDLRTRAASLATVAISFGIAKIAASLVPSPAFQQWLPPALWIDSLTRLLRDATLRAIYPIPFLGVVLFALIVLVLRLRRVRWNVAAAFLAASSVLCGLAAASDWVAKNQYDSRYILLPLLVAALTCLSTLMLPVGEAVSGSLGKEMSLLAACLMILAITTQAFGVPSPGNAITLLERTTRPSAAMFDGTPCTHLIGDYWRTWTAVFHDRLVGRPSPRWPVTFRAEAEKQLWDAMPHSQRTYCAACGDPSLEYMRNLEHIPALTPAGQSGEACLFRTAN